jgi:lipopolysaccharide heptosyltransferase II
VPRLRAAAFDLVVDLQGLFRSAAMAWLTGCPTRVGFANGREGSPLLYTRRVTVPTSEMHAVDRYLLAAATLGAKGGSPECRLRIFPTDTEAVTGLLSRHGVTMRTPWIAMNVSARWPTKRWPPERYAAVADQLNRDGMGPVVLIGGPDERQAAQAVISSMLTNPVDLTGETTVGLLPALLGSAALLLTNDSGPMHIAAAVGTPVVALFGPTSPVRTGPYGRAQRVLRSGVPCSPCFSRVCRNPVHLECLTSIGAGTVIEVVRQQLTLRAAGEGP